MKKLLVLSIILGFVAACTTVPITGRKQMNLLPESQMRSMAATIYSQFISQNPPLPVTDQRVQQVQRVGEKIARAAIRYLQAKGATDRVAGFNWSYNVVNDNTVNAWCMPGGKIVFYTGILPICQDEDGIAVVMGHEVATPLRFMVLRSILLRLTLISQSRPERFFSKLMAWVQPLGPFCHSRVCMKVRPMKWA
jgi:predicted Zn-dependent protease